MNTLSALIEKARGEGFSEDFKIEEDRLHTGNGENQYGPEDVKISNFYRFEGESDPDDNAILYLIETNGGNKGILINAYGAYASQSIGNFIKQVEEMEKKPHQDKSAG